MLLYFIRTFFSWDDQRITETLDSLVAKGAINRNVNGEVRPLKRLWPGAPIALRELTRVASIDVERIPHRCAYCRRRLTKKIATKDHVIPQSRIQGELRKNIVWACKPCNQLKANRTPHEWARDILRYNCKVSNPGPSRLQRWLIQARVAIGSWLAWLAQ